MLVIPLLSTLVVGLLMVYVIGEPVRVIMVEFTRFLQGMGTTNALLLGLLLGGMMAVDMGGPINKAAFFFGAAMIKERNYSIMGCVAAAICTPSSWGSTFAYFCPVSVL